MRYLLIVLVLVMLVGCSTMTKIACFGDKTGEDCAKSWLDAAIYPTTQAMSK